MVSSSVSARFLYGFPYRLQRAWTVLRSTKHPVDVVRVGVWNSLRPPRSLAHQSPLDSLHPHKPKDSYQRPPGQSFHRDSDNSHPTRPVLPHLPKDSLSTRTGSLPHSSHVPAVATSLLDRKDQDKSSQQGRSFYKKGRGGGGNNRRK